MKEKLQEYALIAEIVSAICIVLSLIFVGFQIQQGAEETALNTSAIQVAAYQDLIARVDDLNTLVIQNSEIRELMTKAGFGRLAIGNESSQLQELSLDEMMMYSNLIFLIVRQADLAYFQYETGAIEYDRMLSAISPLLNNLNNPKVIERWDLIKDGFVQSFQNFIDEQIQELN